MNTGRYTLRSFLTDHKLEQIIIPELQRDYVWRPENVKRLLYSIKQDAEKHASEQLFNHADKISGLPPELREVLVRGLEEKQIFSNIGFIYAYYDADFGGRYMLIDGQQRMTTMFLLLLNLHVKEGKHEVFRRTYFKNRIPKLDYKVRESCHNFLVNFIEHCLQDGNVNTVKEQCWYFSIYENDATIQSVLNNYKVIDAYTSTNTLLLSYLELNIEFFYFDTNKTEQGEELYIYMNSRGESVATNENVKAYLLEKLPESQKNVWGEKWETWQSFFWKHRGDNKNADKGFDEFLRWVKIIEEFSKEASKPINTEVDLFRQLKERTKFHIGEITIDKVERYFNSLIRIQEAGIGKYYNPDWLSITPNTLDYVRLLPLLMYAMKYSSAKEPELRRYARFFYNVTRFEAVSKNPYMYSIYSIRLTRKFLDKGYSDAVDFAEFKEDKVFANLLTKEEVWKLKTFKGCLDESDRCRYEEAFWRAEDFRLFDGSIDFILKCVGFEMDKTDEFDLEKFRQYLEHVETLFEKPNDLLRRAILTKGDYSIHDGATPSLGGRRYSFISEQYRWKSAFSSSYSSKCIKALLNDIHQRIKDGMCVPLEQILQKIIDDFINSYAERDWIYYFVVDPSVLAYCNQKFVCFVNETLENIYLLKDKHAAQYNWTKLTNVVNVESVNTTLVQS